MLNDDEPGGGLGAGEGGGAGGEPGGRGRGDETPITVNIFF